MSAYIVSPTSIGAVAAYLMRDDYPYVQEKLKAADKKATVANIAKCLMQENIRSVAYRYPDDKSGSRPGPCNYSDEELIEDSAATAIVYLTAFPRLNAIDIISMCNGLEYQSCETEDYETTIAFKQLQAIKNHAIRNLPGYDTAVRDFYDERFQRNEA